jgi:hypothetical protein
VTDRGPAGRARGAATLSSAWALARPGARAGHPPSGSPTRPDARRPPATQPGLSGQWARAQDTKPEYYHDRPGCQGSVPLDAGGAGGAGPPAGARMIGAQHGVRVAVARGRRQLERRRAAEDRHGGPSH